MNIANPIHPLSPIHPANPASPLNPMRHIHAHHQVNSASHTVADTVSSCCTGTPVELPVHPVQVADTVASYSSVTISPELLYVFIGFVSGIGLILCVLLLIMLLRKK